MELTREYQLRLQMLDKAENGPIIEGSDWDNMITATTRRLLKEYDIRWNARSAPHVFADDELADRLYQAAYQMALEVGVYCLDTKRRLLWTKEELDEIITLSPTSVNYGIQPDNTLEYKRVIEDERPIGIHAGPIGVPSPEALYVSYLEAYAREGLVTSVLPPTLLTAHNCPIRAGSPWEAVGGWVEAQLSLEAVKRAGRPGLSIGGVNIATTEIGELAGSTYGAYRLSDPHTMAFISEFKTAYHQLTKVVHHAHIGSTLIPYFNPMYGGFLGGGPGVALAVAAGIILMRACYGGHSIDAGPTHVHLSCSTYPDIVRATALGFQAVARNSNIMMSSFVRPAAGPGTKEIFYEVAALTIATTVSGASSIIGVQSAGGTHAMHATPLECRFMAQVAQACAGMCRENADTIVTRLVEKYASGLKTADIGQPFTALYDMETLEPVLAWQKMYLEACKEMENELGLSF